MEINKMKEFINKHKKEIITGIAVAPVCFISAAYAMKNEQREPIHISNTEARKKPYAATNEERKYANWLCYEKESNIYDAYNEYKIMKDFG